MITDYLEDLLGEGTPHNTSKGMQYSYRCPLCGDYKERLFINVDRGKFMCHNCQSYGSIVTFISEYSGTTWKQALEVYREYEGYEVELPESIEEEVYAKLIQAPSIEINKYVHPLPDEFIFIDEAHGKAGNEAWRYLKQRGVSMDTAIEQGIGYCAEGDYSNRIIMPDFEDGELVYWQARTWEPEPKKKILKKFYRKVLNPSLSKEQIEQGIVDIGKSEVLGNIDNVLINRMAILCEGKFDQYTLLSMGACLHGKHMSDDQFLKLVKNKDKIDIVTVFLDGDAFKQAVVTADRLSKHFDDVLICKLPLDADPNSLGTRRCMELLNQAVKYDSMFKIKAQLKGWA